VKERNATLEKNEWMYGAWWDFVADIFGVKPDFRGKLKIRSRFFGPGPIVRSQTFLFSFPLYHNS
jgi:hypothetical protein